MLPVMKRNHLILVLARWITTFALDAGPMSEDCRIFGNFLLLAWRGRGAINICVGCRRRAWKLKATNGIIRSRIQQTMYRSHDLVKRRIRVTRFPFDLTQFRAIHKVVQVLNSKICVVKRSEKTPTRTRQGFKRRVAKEP